MQPSLPLPLRIFQQLENWWQGSANDAQKTVVLKDPGEHTIPLDMNDPFLPGPDKLLELQELDIDIIYSIEYRFGMPENLSSASQYGLWYPVTPDAPHTGFLGSDGQPSGFSKWTGFPERWPGKDGLFGYNTNRSVFNQEQ